MAAIQRSTHAEQTQPVVRFRLRINDGDTIAIGPGKIAVLEAIASTGSITAAAKSLDMSYRRAWLLMDELNRSLREPALDSTKGGQSGGGTALTEAGLALIEVYRRIEEQAVRTNQAELAQLTAMLAR